CITRIVASKIEVHGGRARLLRGGLRYDVAFRMRSILSIVVGHRSGSNMPQVRLACARIRSLRLRGCGRLREYRTDVIRRNECATGAQQFDRISLQNGVALPQAGVTRVKRAATL